jgi:hypothetical protein
MKKTLNIALLLCMSLPLFAQNMFTHEQDRFHRDIGSNLSFTGEVREDASSMRREFSNFWTSDTLNFQEKQSFILTANLMGSKGAKDYPDFVCYAANIMCFKRFGLYDTHYEPYEDAIKDMLGDRRPKLKEFSDFMLTINRLVDRNIVCKNPRTFWSAKKNNYTFNYIDKEFIIKFNKVDLIGYQGIDSLKIEQTDASYYPDSKTWNGSGGFVTWERVGYGRDSIMAELSNYRIDLRSITYTADSVRFTNSIFFRTPMLGRLIDKARNIDDPGRSNYPRFISYQQHFEIKNIVQGIDYEGGFSIHGQSFIGSGTKESPAKFTITKNDTISLTARSQKFTIDRANIISDQAAIVLRLGEDSIFHPHLTFKFHNNIGFLELIRTKDDMSKVNYVNSYHAVNMDFTYLKWYIDKFKIEMSMISTPGVPNESFFESVDYYRYSRYKEIQKRDQRHPVEVVTSFASYWGSTEFTLMELSKYMGFSPHQVIRMVMDLAYRNYLRFDTETEEILLYPEALRFLEAHRKVRDSDVLQFYSKTPENIPNAELSLLNFDLKLNGIPTVHLSDSQSVKIHPIDLNIILKKNRTFTFNGTIQAGQFFFYGNNFKFDYENFLIDIAHCDSMKMVAETQYLDEQGEPQKAIVRNKLEGFNGTYKIDEPFNKSGNMDFPEFPKFITNTKSFVYFDRPDIYSGVYDRNRFYFEIDPFEKDSIGGFSGDNLVFEGTLVSAGIFPDIKENLVLRRQDFSLGFRTNTGPVGYPVYEGLATYWHEIDLSNHGLRGKGKLDYLVADINANELLFFPDSVHGHAQNFNITAKDIPVQYPKVQGVDNTLNWKVREDQFKISQNSEKFEMFNGQATLEGSLNLTTRGLYGEGMMEFETALLSSNDFSYKKETIESDTASFELLSENLLAKNFESHNVRAYVDFVERKGVFKSNGENTIWRFPENQYISEMNELTWYMDKDELEISASSDVLSQIENTDFADRPQDWEDLFLEGPRFTSIHPAQDSLFFVAPRARYNYRKHIITAEGVEFIRVADAIIYPGNKEIVVEKRAVMRPIENASVTANITTRYHEFYDGTINIFGRRNYSGYGDYNYLDAFGTIQKVHFNRIGVDASGESFANAELSEPDSFMISPNHHFLGKISINASHEFFEYDGAVKMMHECENLESNWIKFKERIDPEYVYIPIQGIQFDINDNRLYSGLLLTRTRQLYPAFLSRKTSQYDEEIFTVDGYLYYDIDDGNYKIGQKDKIEETSLPGGYIEMHKFICNVFGEGQMNFSKDFGQFKPNAIGNFRYNPQTDTTEFFLSMIMDAYFNNSATKMMANRISSTGGLAGLDLRDKSYEKAIVEYLGTEKANEWLSNLSLGSFGRMPRELQEKFILTELRFIWYPDMNSFIHYGPIGIANMGRDQVNRYVFGFIRIEKSRRGDMFEMLLEPDSETWYYFRYNAGTFSGLSSDEDFNKEVYDTKPSQRELKVSEGPAYQYGLGSSTHMRSFKRDMYRKFDIEDDME